jgi:hypothetical protein
MSLTALLEFGCKPYIATSAHLVSSFNLEPFGTTLQPHFDSPQETMFHLAYIRSNTIAFDADLSMPHWVYIDYVLLQTAAVGFMLPKYRLPRDLIARFEKDPLLKLEQLEYLPISGQTAGLAVDGKTWTGVSLFSLAKYLPELKSLGIAVHTRALALAAYKARYFVGITQYDNPAVAIHGKTTRELFIKQPAVWIHPRTHMTFIYEQEIDYSLDTLKDRDAEPYTFLLRADDLEHKELISQGIARGIRYKIVPPFRIIKGDKVFLPIVEV